MNQKTLKRLVSAHNKLIDVKAILDEYHGTIRDFYDRDELEHHQIALNELLTYVHEKVTFEIV